MINTYHMPQGYMIGGRLRDKYSIPGRERSEEEKAAKQKTYGYLAATFVLWGSLYVVTQFVLGKIPTFTAAMLRYLCSFAALSAVASKREKEHVRREDYRYFFIVGFIGYFLAVACQLLGTKLAGASMASLINSLNPVFISIMAVFILKEKLTREKVVGLALSIAGVYLIIGHDAAASAVGLIYSFLAVIGWAYMSVISRKISARYSPLTITRYAMLIAAVCNMPAALLEIRLAQPVIRVDFAAVLGLLYMGLVCTALTNVLWNKALSQLPANTCSAFYPVQTVTSSLLGIIVFHEVLTASFVVGTALIIAGVLFSLLGGEKHASGG